MTRRLAAGIVLLTLGGAPAFAQTSVSVALRHATRAVGTHDVLPATAQGVVIGTSTRVIGRLGAWGSFTTWPEPIGRTVALGGRFDLSRDDWKLRPAVLLGTWRKPTRGAPWQLIFGGGVGFRIRGRWSGSVALGAITIRSTGLLYAVPQAGVAYTLLP
ncbi:MAG: hypothetical protein OXH04_13880 [Acidobacteria bacterium]|nr:hypothetical protein [Acidobacteriota bacterium]